MDLKNLAETIYLKERELSQRIGGKVTVTITLHLCKYRTNKPNTCVI
jgi:hypothetical protein